MSPEIIAIILSSFALAVSLVTLVYRLFDRAEICRLTIKKGKAEEQERDGEGGFTTIVGVDGYEINVYNLGRIPIYIHSTNYTLNNPDEEGSLYFREKTRISSSMIVGGDRFILEPLRSVHTSISLKRLFEKATERTITRHFRVTVQLESGTKIHSRIIFVKKHPKA